MSRVAAETSRANAMVLTSDHAAQPGKVAFGAVDVDTVEETVGIGMVDPLKVEVARELVPMRRLVGDELGAPCDFRSCEAHRLGFVLENVRQRAAIALADSDDASAVFSSMRSEASIDAIGARVRMSWTRS